MQNATLCHLVCIGIPKEQESEMMFDLDQRLLSNQAKKMRTWSEKQRTSLACTQIYLKKRERK